MRGTALGTTRRSAIHSHWPLTRAVDNRTQTRNARAAVGNRGRIAAMAKLRDVQVSISVERLAAARAMLENLSRVAVLLNSGRLASKLSAYSLVLKGATPGDRSPVARVSDALAVHVHEWEARDPEAALTSGLREALQAVREIDTDRE